MKSTPIEYRFFESRNCLTFFRNRFLIPVKIFRQVTLGIAIFKSFFCHFLTLSYFKLSKIRRSCSYFPSLFLEFGFIISANIPHIATKKAFYLNFFFTFSQQDHHLEIFISDVLHDLVPFTQFRKREKHPWKSVIVQIVTNRARHHLISPQIYSSLSRMQFLWVITSIYISIDKNKW